MDDDLEFNKGIFSKTIFNLILNPASDAGYFFKLCFIQLKKHQ